MTRRCGFGAMINAALTFVLCTLVPIAATAQPAPTMDQALAAIAAYAPRSLAEQGAPGMSVAITDRTHTLKIIALGYANVDSKAPVTPAVRFPIGSISKSMTALLLLQQHDRGLVNLNAPVQTYLPWWKIDSNGKPIVVHQLLSHTAGIPDDFTDVASYGFAVAALRNARTVFAPGTSWSYSNDGFATVGAIAAAVGRRPWQDQIATDVFARIGMTRSSAYFTPELMADAAVGYLIRDQDRTVLENPTLVPAQNYDFVDPAGSVISTPADMATYMRLYLNGGKTEDGRQLISTASFAAMTQADKLSDGKPAGAAGAGLAEWPAFYTRYGYGLSIFDTDGDHLIGHTGGISGYTACMQANLTRGFGVAAMSNLVEAPLHPCAIVRYAMAVLRAQSAGEPLPPAPAPPADPAAISNASDYAGRYASRDGDFMTVTANGRTLTINDAGNSYRMVGQGGDSFATDDPRLRTYVLNFHRTRKKTIDGFNYGSTLYFNASYRGPHSFSHPSAWDAYAGRYENVIWGEPAVTRVVIVGNRLTFDGVDPLIPQKDGSFVAGSSRVRFDTPAEGLMQRMWIDGGDFYRVGLP